MAVMGETISAAFAEGGLADRAKPADRAGGRRGEIAPFTETWPSRRDAVPLRRTSVLGRLARLFRWKRSAIEDAYLLFETALLLAAGLVVLELYVGGALAVPSYRQAYAAPIALGLVAIILSLRAKGLYRFPRLVRFSANVGDVLVSLLRAFAALVVIGFVLKVTDNYSRLWVVGWLFLSIPVVLLSRAFVAALLAELLAQGHVLRRAAVYGPRKHAGTLAARLAGSSTGVGVAGVFGEAARAPLAPVLRAHDASAQDVIFDGDLGDLLRHARTRPLDVVFVVLDPGAPAADAERALAALSALPIEVRLFIVTHAPMTPPLGAADKDGVRSFAVQGAPMLRSGRVVKAVVDRVGAAVLLTLLSPLLLLVALAVRLQDGGPAIYRQRRHGFNRHAFDVFKFRTMSVMEEGGAVVQARRGDARVTSVGRFLRGTSLDELPQLVNVLRGEMSLVGPRPHPVNLDSHYEALLERYARRQKVKPGITGLAQIGGLRGPTPELDMMRQRVEEDLRYIENWSLWLDLRILLATPFVGFVNRNAL